MPCSGRALCCASVRGLSQAKQAVPTSQEEVEVLGDVVVDALVNVLPDAVKDVQLPDVRASVDSLVARLQGQTLSNGQTLAEALDRADLDKAFEVLVSSPKLRATFDQISEKLQQSSETMSTVQQQLSKEVLVVPPPPPLCPPPQVTRRANRKKRLTVLYIVEHPNQEGDACIDWTSQYCWTNGWNCLWRGHSVYRNRPLIPPPLCPPPPPTAVSKGGGAVPPLCL